MPGKRRGVAPVAMTRPSKPTRSPPPSSTSRAARSRPGGGRAELPVEVELGRGVGRERDPLEAPLASQDLLGQRRAVVGQVGLVTDQGEATVEALRPQLLGGAEALPSRRRRSRHDRATCACACSPRSGAAQPSIDDCLLGAAADGFLDLAAQLLGRALPAASRGSRRRAPRRPRVRRPCTGHCSRRGRSPRRRASVLLVSAAAAEPSRTGCRRLVDAERRVLVGQ